MTSTRRGYDPRSFEADMYDHHAQQATCPTDTGGCGAHPGQPCINPHTGQPTPVSHWQRDRAAHHLQDHP